MEGEAQADLELNAEDAENVVGGKKAAHKAKKPAAHKAGPNVASSVVVAAPMGAVDPSDVGDSGVDMDPSNDPDC
jgi:hypothetical protein